MEPAFEPDKGQASRIQNALNGSKRGVADGCGLQNENKIRGIAATATTDFRLFSSVNHSWAHALCL
jgi:hypothetical protein